MSRPAADWDALADRLEAVADALMDAAPAAPDETELQLMELHAVSIRHVARRLRLFPDAAPNAAPDSRA
ncbi:MAG: hypothetical protein KIT16_00200 [Rhodospirillaceae bacterium]|nr:hypothetical protein [Rhodospirillaceae bacterium]